MRVFQPWLGVLVVVGLTGGIGPMALAASREEAEAKVVFTPVAWEANFRRALHAPWASADLVAVSPTTPTRLLLRVDHSDRPIYFWRERELRKLGKAGESGGGVNLPPLPKELSVPHLDMDLWLADPDGSHARFLHNFKDCWVKALEWSPDGQELFTQDVPTTSDNKPRPARIQVLDLKTLKSWQIADQGEEMPCWGPNGQTLFFWRKMADAIVTPNGSVTAYARWQLFRAEAPWDKPAIRLATRTALSEPSSLLPDGKRLLYVTLSRDRADGLLHFGPAVIETLASGKVEPLIPDGEPIPERHPEDIMYQYPGPLWSGNSRWMFHSAALRLGRMNNVLYDLTTHQQTDLNPLLNVWADTVLKRTREESLRIQSAAWLGPEDPRLLLELTTFVFQGDFGPHSWKGAPPKHGWIVYDPIQGKLLPVEGLALERGPFSRYSLFRVGEHYCLLGKSTPVLSNVRGG